MQVVAFTGMPGAGKSEAVAEARERGFPIVIMGDFVRAAAKEKGLAPTDENLGRVASQMRAEHGADVWAQKTCDHIQAKFAADRLVVIDGVRTPAEIATMRKRLGRRFHLIAIHAPEDLRVERLKKRGRSDDPQERKQLEARDQREIGWGLLDAIKSADISIENTPPLSAFRRRVGAALDKFTSA